MQVSVSSGTSRLGPSRGRRLPEQILGTLQPHVLALKY